MRFFCLKSTALSNSTISLVPFKGKVLEILRCVRIWPAINGISATDIVVFFLYHKDCVKI